MQEFQLRSPLFKIKKVTVLELKDIPSLCECVAQYIISAEPNARIDQILSLLHKNAERGAVWFLYKQKEVVGLLTGHIDNDLYGDSLCVVDFFMVNKDVHRTGYAKKIADIGIAWAKQQGTERIMFATIRNPEAMCRFLPGSWKVDSTLISLNLCA